MPTDVLTIADVQNAVRELKFWNRGPHELYLTNMRPAWLFDMVPKEKWLADGGPEPPDLLTGGEWIGVLYGAYVFR